MLSCIISSIVECDEYGLHEMLFRVLVEHKYTTELQTCKSKHLGAYLKSLAIQQNPNDIEIISSNLIRM
jgi:hypothetical protein